jgi:hypothetical protein
MNKKLNVSAIQNELSGQSVFFSRKVATSNEDNNPEKPKPAKSENSVQEVQDVRDVRGVHPPVKREKKRHPFDIYRDQLESLHRMKNEYGIQNGEIRTMSAMVREALDQYIQTNSKHK